MDDHSYLFVRINIAAGVSQISRFSISGRTQTLNTTRSYYYWHHLGSEVGMLYRTHKRVLSYGTAILAASLFPTVFIETSLAKEDSDEYEKAVSTFDVFNHGHDQIDGRKHSAIRTLNADVAMRSADVNRAIIAARQAVELNPEDMDARVALGEALYQKVKKDKKGSQGLYNECVKTWLTVYRNLVGEETGLNFKGIGWPLAQRFFADDNHVDVAKERLNDLCGRVPRAWETNNRFLKKVLLPEEKVSAEVLSKAPRKADDAKVSAKPTGKGSYKVERTE